MKSETHFSDNLFFVPPRHNISSHCWQLTLLTAQWQENKRVKNPRLIIKLIMRCCQIVFQWINLRIFFFGTMHLWADRYIDFLLVLRFDPWIMVHLVYTTIPSVRHYPFEIFLSRALQFSNHCKFSVVLPIMSHTCSTGHKSGEHWDYGKRLDVFTSK